MGELRDRRVLFTKLYAQLIQHVNDTPEYECAFGETLRSDEQAYLNSMGVEGRLALRSYLMGKYPRLAHTLENNGKGGGIFMSLHRDGLAGDLVLYRNGVWQTSTEVFRPFGEWWEKQHTLARWGGRFGDGNHFSIEFDGRK